MGLTEYDGRVFRGEAVVGDVSTSTVCGRHYGGAGKSFECRRDAWGGGMSKEEKRGKLERWGKGEMTIPLYSGFPPA